MTRYPDLEIGLHRYDAEHYLVDLRYSDPESDADVRLSPGRQLLAQFDFPALLARSLDPLAYGQALSASLFANPELRDIFSRALASAHTINLPLRLRLYLGPSAPELHTLHWETLCDPADGQPLLMDAMIAFSRYLSSGDWRPIQLRPRRDLRAIVAVASPADLSAYQLEPFDATAEAACARASLDQIAVTALAGPGQATLDAILQQLREGADILYLLCHGALVEGQPWLWLEDEQGATARVAGEILAQRLHDLRERPRLVVLASCQSAGIGDGLPRAITAALNGLGPRLAEAGIPAVLAMQGRVSAATASRFLSTFFCELQRDGQIDRAMSTARSAVAERPDAWMPVLFLRLRSGSIWYVPGFGDERESFEKWPAILRNIQRGQCTPLIGPHINEALLGSPRDMAQRWAETYRFPMAPHQREDLPQVAQYLAVNQDRRFPHEELREYERQELHQRFGSLLADLPTDAPLAQVFATVGARRWSEHPTDPYRVLAGLPFPIFVTASTDNLLVEALRATGKDPQVEFCRWNDDLATLPSVFQGLPRYKPSPERPLVFHIFGIEAEPDSFVLTEDDYFDYLLGVARNKELIPPEVRDALVDTALLFLGFRLESWDFRVLFRSLMSQEGRRRRGKYANIAGQVMPEEGQFLEPERARRYLESYFEGAYISIFWGSVDDFVQELARRWTASASATVR